MWPRRPFGVLTPKTLKGDLPRVIGREHNKFGFTNNVCSKSLKHIPIKFLLKKVVMCTHTTKKIKCANCLIVVTFSRSNFPPAVGFYVVCPQGRFAARRKSNFSTEDIYVVFVSHRCVLLQAGKLVAIWFDLLPLSSNCMEQTSKSTWEILRNVLEEDICLSLVIDCRCCVVIVKSTSRA